MIAMHKQSDTLMAQRPSTPSSGYDTNNMEMKPEQRVEPATQKKGGHPAHQLLDGILLPFTWVHNQCQGVLRTSKTTTHIVLGASVMVTGSVIAAVAPHDPFVLHVAVDVAGYYLHGMGAAPIIKVVLEFFGVEGA